MDRFDLGSIWGLAVVVGPILFLLVLGWVMLHNRQSRRERERTERGTKALQEELDRESRPATRGPRT